MPKIILSSQKWTCCSYLSSKSSDHSTFLGMWPVTVVFLNHKSIHPKTCHFRQQFGERFPWPWTTVDLGGTLLDHWWCRPHAENCLHVAAPAPEPPTTMIYQPIEALLNSWAMRCIVASEVLPPLSGPQMLLLQHCPAVRFRKILQDTRAEQLQKVMFFAAKHGFRNQSTNIHKPCNYDCCNYIIGVSGGRVY